MSDKREHFTKICPTNGNIRAQMSEEPKTEQEEKDPRITIRLDDEMYAAVERVQKRKRWVKTQVVKDALVRMLEQEGELRPSPTQKVDLETR